MDNAYLFDIYKEIFVCFIMKNKKVIKLTESDLHKIIIESVNKILKEDYEDGLSNFDEYKQDYPNGDFSAVGMTSDDLAEWCENVGDFLYIYKGLRGWSIMAANTDNIVKDIVSDLYNCDRIEPTHEMDYLFNSREREFDAFYVCIFKVIGTKDGDYYVVYEKEK